MSTLIRNSRKTKNFIYFKRSAADQNIVRILLTRIPPGLNNPLNNSFSLENFKNIKIKLRNHQPRSHQP